METKNEIERFINRRMLGIQGDINYYVEEAAKDYERFFVWHSEDLYKSKLMMKFYKDLADHLNSGCDMKVFKDYIEYLIEKNTDDLVKGEVRRQSTSELSNLAHICEREVKQRMISICKGIIKEYIKS